MEKRRRRAILLIAAALMLALAAIAISRFMGEELEKRTYRLEHTECIAKYAGQYRLDPYLAAAVIHTESSNRPEAVSASGARGLMQVMPETGEWIAGKLKEEGYTPERLFEPELNVRYGCWYLRFLLDRYGQETPLALAAYNAGQGTVDRWLGDPAVSEKGALVNIPYPETEKYVDKVQRAYEKYQYLYPEAF